MENTLGEDMKDSYKVGFLATAIAGYQPFQSIKASLDTNVPYDRTGYYLRRYVTGPIQ